MDGGYKDSPWIYVSHDEAGVMRKRTDFSVRGTADNDTDVGTW